MIVPVKPFPEYKWRWATVTCTEGLNAPSVFLGVLRAMSRYDGKRTNSEGFIDALARVKDETGTNVNLVRDAERNIIRNSGQYWKALGLIEPEERGLIRLTPFGKSLASGEISPSEFAATVVRTLELPNPRIDENVSSWDQHGLRIKPLALLLRVLSGLETAQAGQGFMTDDELVKIVIPLAGSKATVEQHVEALRAFRVGGLDLAQWPNCVSGANDKRIAREFLLFLVNYGFCRKHSGRYYLSDMLGRQIQAFLSLPTTASDSDAMIAVTRTSCVPGLLERQRVLVSVLARPQQAAFRQEVLVAFKGKCLLTGVALPDVLEAAHLRPVEYDGDDSLNNGLCLRADLHRLFDSGHLRMEPNGKVHLSSLAARRENYAVLPDRVRLPSFVSSRHLSWRWNYV